MKKVILLFFSISLLWSCKKNNDMELGKQDDPISIQEHKWNNSVLEVSKAVNVLLRQTSFRNYLKAEVLKRFDGDYDVLISKIIEDSRKPQSINTTTPIGGAAPQNQDANSIENQWPETALNVLEEMSEIYPLLQLSVQIDPTAWSTDYIPNVVYLDASYEEDATMFVSGYDQFGNSIQMDAKIEPLNPVVIVGGNERGFIDLNGVYSLYDAHIGDILIDEPEPTDTLIAIDPNEPIQWYRKNYKYEAIYAMRYDNLNVVEGWPAGAPETKISVFTIDPSDSTKYIEHQKGTHEPPRRKNINGKWWDSGPSQMHLWRWFQTGTTFKYAFYEYDYSPISQKDYKEIGNLAGSVLDSLKLTQVPIPLGGFVRYWYAVTGLALPKENHKSEFLGEIEMSTNNNTTEFSIPTGGFKFISKPMQ